MPKKFGGAGLSHFEAVLVLEEIAKISIAIAFPIFESSFGPALAISHFAPEELKKEFFPRFVKEIWLWLYLCLNQKQAQV